MTNKALEIAKELCNQHDCKLIYLTKVGSHLYGTDTTASDFDYKGICLPNIENLVMGKQFKSIEYTKDNPYKIDLQLFSLQYWLNTLVRKGETEGIDLLYSSSNKNAVIYSDIIMKEILLNVRYLFDPRKMDAFVGFAIEMARRYSVKSARFSVLKNILEFLKKSSIDGKSKLSSIMYDIDDLFHDDDYCFMFFEDDIEELMLCGTIHMGTITIDEFKKRVKGYYERYGSRTKTAESLEGRDWKSLSHAVRAIDEVIELLKTKDLVFPLKRCEYLRDIKLGKIDFSEIEEYIEFGLEHIKQLKDDFTYNWNYNENIVKNDIFKIAYNL